MSTAASAEVRLDVSFIEANEESLNLITNEERAFLSLASLDGYIDDDFDCDMLPEKIYEVRPAVLFSLIFQQKNGRPP